MGCFFASCNGDREKGEGAPFLDVKYLHQRNSDCPSAVGHEGINGIQDEEIKSLQQVLMSMQEEEEIL